MSHANCSNLITDWCLGYWKLTEEDLTDNLKLVLDLFTDVLIICNVNYENYEQLKMKNLRETLNFLNLNLNSIKTYRKACRSKRKQLRSILTGTAIHKEISSWGMTNKQGKRQQLHIFRQPVSRGEQRQFESGQGFQIVKYWKATSYCPFMATWTR